MRKLNLHKRWSGHFELYMTMRTKAGDQICSEDPISEWVGQHALTFTATVQRRLSHHIKIFSNCENALFLTCPVSPTPPPPSPSLLPLTAVWVHGGKISRFEENKNHSNQNSWLNIQAQHITLFNMDTIKHEHHYYIIMRPLINSLGIKWLAIITTVLTSVTEWLINV